MISPALVLVILFAVLVLVTLFAGIRIVPQGSKFVVERLGKFHNVLNPGLNFIIPYVDSVAYKVSTKDIVLDIPSQEVITSDNAVITVNAISFINVLHPEKASYGVENFQLAIRNLVQTSLRSIIGDMKLDEALSSRDQIKARVKESITDDLSPWGILLKTVEIQDINPSPTMAAAMEQQAAAERTRRATVTEADGQKMAAILAADGKLEAAKREADAKRLLAQADRDAILLVTESVGEKELPALFLLGQRYVAAMQSLGESHNAKVVVLPADIPAAIRGIFGANKDG